MTVIREKAVTVKGYRAMVVQFPQVQVEKKVVRKLRPWVKKALVSMVVVPALTGGLLWSHLSKPVLEENVQWVEVEVPNGGGYDAAIRAGYAKMDKYDVSIVDIRDLRWLAMERNNHESLKRDTVIEVPVYTLTKRYR